MLDMPIWCQRIACGSQLEEEVGQGVTAEDADVVLTGGALHG